MGKTRKDHKCEICGKIIPKGTDTSEIIIEAEGGRVSHRHTLGSHHGAFSYWGYRRYYHKDCKIIEEIAGKRDSLWHGVFFVQRGITEITYQIGEHEITVPLVKGNLYSIENWNRAVKKDDEIYEFSRKNGLTTYPELKLKEMQEADQ